MHVGTDGVDRGALPCIETRRQQASQARLRPILRQADHLAVHQVREHRVELLRLAAVNLVGAEVPGTAARPLAIPVAQERVLRSTRFPPTDAVADGRMRRRHRLTVHPNLLPQAPRHPRLRIGELDAFGADAALSTPDPSLPIHQRHWMRRPRHIVPRAVTRRSHTARASTTATASIASDPAALDADRQPAVDRVAVTLRRHHPKLRQPQNPRTIAPRSHRSSLVVRTSREDDTGWSGARGIALIDQAAEQTAHPSAVRAGGRVITSNRCTQIGEQPEFDATATLMQLVTED